MFYGAKTVYALYPASGPRLDTVVVIGLKLSAHIRPAIRW